MGRRPRRRHRPAGHVRHRPRDPFVQLGRGRPASDLPPGLGRRRELAPAHRRPGERRRPRRDALRRRPGPRPRHLAAPPRPHPRRPEQGQPRAPRRLPARARDREARARRREPGLLRLARGQRASPARRDAHARRRVGGVRARRRDPARARRRRRDLEPGDRVHRRRLHALRDHARRGQRRRPRADHPRAVARDARRRPDLRRRRCRAPSGHAHGRDRELPARAARAPGAGSRPGARHRRDHGASPRRRVPDLARPCRPHVDGRVHGRRRPGGLLRVRSRRAVRALPLHAARRPRPIPALRHGAVRVHGPRRPRDPRLPDVPAGRAPPEPSHRALRARRAVGARHLGLRPDRAVARQPRLPVRPGELPRVVGLRQGVPERGRPRVGPQDARRPDRRRRARGRPRRRRPLARRHLRRLLRRLCRARRGDVHARRLPLRRRRRRPVEPAHAARDDPAVLEAARLAVPSPRRPPRDATSTSCGSARRSRAWPTSASRS